jgi:hypothetical protein
MNKQNILGELVRFCKEELDIQSVSVVSNGSKVREAIRCRRRQ